jgi:hypothetical protein
MAANGGQPKVVPIVTSRKPAALLGYNQASPSFKPGFSLYFVFRLRAARGNLQCTM